MAVRSRRWRRVLGALALVPVALAGGVVLFIQRTRAGLDAMEARIREEIAAEDRRPAERLPVLRGTPREGDIIDEVARVLRGIAPIDTGTYARARRWLGSEDSNSNIPFAEEPRWTSRLEEVRARVAGFVPAIREALARETAGFRYMEIPRAETYEGIDDVKQRWQALGVRPESIETARLALDLEAARHLCCGSTREAARVWADARRLRHVLARFDNWANRTWWPCDVITAALVQRLDEAGLAAWDRELVLLEASLPSYATALRRERLDVGRALAAARGHGAISRASRSPATRWQRFVSPLTAEYRLWRGWQRLDETLRAFEQSAPAAPPFGEERVVEALQNLDTRAGDAEPAARVSWAPLRGAIRTYWLYDLHLTELARLRIARAAIAVVRFQRAHRRWPETHAEALGRDPRVEELDPLADRPLELAFRNVGQSQVRSSHEEAWALGATLALQFEPTSAVVGDGEVPPTDVALERVPVARAVADIARLVHRPIVLGPRAWGPPLDVVGAAATPTDAIAAVASAARCDVVSLPGGTVWLDPQPLVSCHTESYEAGRLVQVVADRVGFPARIGQAFEKPVALDVDDVDWRIVLERIAGAVGQRIEVVRGVIYAGAESWVADLRTPRALASAYRFVSSSVTISRAILGTGRGTTRHRLRSGILAP